MAPTPGHAAKASKRSFRGTVAATDNPLDAQVKFPATQRVRPASATHIPQRRNL